MLSWSEVIDPVAEQNRFADVVSVQRRDETEFAQAYGLADRAGSIANIGVHGTPVELPMQDMWIRNVRLTMGLVDTVSIPTLLKW